MNSNPRNKTAKNPTQAFACCPKCRSQDLISIDSDLLCANCDWDSCRVSVEAGLFDDFFSQSQKIDFANASYSKPKAPKKNDEQFMDLIPA